ncbi:MAG: hypothetical protein KC492_10965 [Myxococcales bacterium]|nr:hypothetical protein [Myxococcales bacterium]
MPAFDAQQLREFKQPSSAILIDAECRRFRYAPAARKEGRLEYEAQLSLEEAKRLVCQAVIAGEPRRAIEACESMPAIARYFTSDFNPEDFVPDPRRSAGSVRILTVLLLAATVAALLLANGSYGPSALAAIAVIGAFALSRKFTSRAR